MKIENSIRSKLKEAFKPQYLSVINESQNHHVPPGSETHFQVIVVSDHFSGLSRVKRQQEVYKVLQQELDSGVHALSQKAWSPEEWRQKAGDLGFTSPNCKGGNKL